MKTCKMKKVRRMTVRGYLSRRLNLPNGLAKVSLMVFNPVQSRTARIARTVRTSIVRITNKTVEHNLAVKQAALRNELDWLKIRSKQFYFFGGEAVFYDHVGNQLQNLF